MKRLYIARHAKSSWEDFSLSDVERPLNKRGKRDAPFMAGVMACRNERPALIVSSPAVRAKATAEYYRHYLGATLTFDARIYEASAITLYYVVLEAFEQTESLMIVGHNPGLTELNDYLSDKSIYNIPTAGIVAIDFADEVTPKSGKQHFFLYPKYFVPHSSSEA